jgi:conjugative relaxase-like TrwC/TraI family protein
MGQGSDLLGLEGHVEYPDLARLLRGCHPESGRFLPAWKPARRRAGWDLTLAAPKSVSLLAALAAGGDEVTAAHRAAVHDVVDEVERLLTVRRAAEPGGRSPSAGAVAACFDHPANGSGEPHLHSHLLLCNLGCDRVGVWSALTSSWWTGRRALGAVYQLGLRYHLRAGGLDLDWRMHEDGLADLAGVPRAAVRAASGRSRAAAHDRAAFQTAGGGGRTFAIRSGATIQSRAASRASRPGPDRARTAGFGPAEADALLAAARVEAGPSRAATDRERGPELERAVTLWLANARSSFRRDDVLVALAACAPGGLAGREAAAWAERFCQAAASPVETGPTASPRWTTAMARAADRRLVERAELAVDAVAPSLAEGRAAWQQLLGSTASVQILSAPPGRTNLLAHAAVLELAVPAWWASGLRVAVATAGEPAEIRWRTLTGIPPHRPGSGPDVLIVDHADRRSTAQLLALLAALKPSGRAILLEGGTRPYLSRPRSDGLTWLGERWGRIDPGPAPVWVERVGSGGGQWQAGSRPTACRSAAEAAGILLGQWATSTPDPRTAALVGMGYPEVDELNRAARAVLARRGDLSGPSLSCGGREFQAGERVVALRHLSGDLPRGIPVEVVAVDARRSTLTVSHRGTRVTVDRRAAGHLGYGYAVTPGLAAHVAARLLVLGPPSALGPHQGRVMTAAVTAPAPELAPDRDRNRVATRQEWTAAGLVPDRRAGRGIG